MIGRIHIEVSGRTFWSSSAASGISQLSPSTLLSIGSRLVLLVFQVFQKIQCSLGSQTAFARKANCEENLKMQTCSIIVNGVHWCFRSFCFSRPLSAAQQPALIWIRTSCEHWHQHCRWRFECIIQLRTWFSVNNLHAFHAKSISMASFSFKRPTEIVRPVLTIESFRVFDGSTSERTQT